MSENEAFESLPLTDQLRILREQITSDKQRSFFKHSGTPSFVVHRKSGRFVDVNEAFLSLFGYPHDQLIAGSVRASELLISDERNLFKRAQTVPDHISDGPYTSAGLNKEGETFPIRLSISSQEVSGQPLLFGSVWKHSDLKRKIEALEEQLENVFQSNKQLLRLREKVRAVSDIIMDLLTVNHEFEVLTEAGTKFCERSEMNIQDTSFYLLNQSEDQLEPAYSEQVDAEAIPVDSCHPVANMLAGKTRLKQSEGNVFLVPLYEGNNRVGVIRMTFDPDKRKLMEQDQTIWKWFTDLLRKIGELISTIFHHCKLYRQKRLAVIHDPLTGIFSRTYFNEQFEEELYRAQRYNNPLSLMLIDINDFKMINDRYGHQQGDVIIRNVARTLHTHSRKSDMLYRYGGDEFVMLLPHTGGVEAEQMARNIIDTFQDNTFSVSKPDGSEKQIMIKISIGISSFPGSNSSFPDELDDMEELQKRLLKTADDRMYQAKESDKHNIVRKNSQDCQNSGV